MHMRHSVAVGLVVAGGLALQAAPASANPFVIGDTARITVVTPDCVRLEYQSGGQFIDAPSMFAVGRQALDAGATMADDGGTYTIETPRLTLRYTPDGQPFSASNLLVSIRGGRAPITWTPASKQTDNLGGTINTLDQVKGPVGLEEGILSRDGWYLIDDSKGFLLTDGWVAPRPAQAGTDWYLFAYGDDYPAAFRAFTTIGGAVPMPRKVALGSWYSRWWHYTTQDYKDIVNEYAEHDFPLDIIVMDMEWHTGPWTGFSWNTELLDDPPALLQWFHDQGLAVTMNIHPADGVAPTETMYADFMKDIGHDPASGETVPFDAGDRRYMEAWFRHTHHPHEDEGVDFWWLDWQQYPDVKSMPGLLNLSWLNKLYFDNSMRGGKRGLQFSRWGNWGDHRHPIHFSGDADTGWAMLGFEVPFTSTAANEGAYFWSHDIGGHFGDRNEETYTRWVQFAATSAAIRIHSGIIEYLDRRPWKWPDWATESMRRSFHLRSRMMPYIYSAVHETNATGLPLNRPMYLQWPDAEEAYAAPQQFLFGHDVLVAPIAAPGLGPGRVASQLVWFPEGEWRNFFTSEAVTGPQWRVVSADINEFPIYVRAGVPIPLQPYSARPTTARPDTLEIHVWPGPDGETNRFTLYEDDGVSRDYEAGNYTTTTLSTLRRGDVMDVSVAPPTGQFPDQVSERAYTIVLNGLQEPTQVVMNGEAIDSVYDEAQSTVTVAVPTRSVYDAVTISVNAKRRPDGHFAAVATGRRIAGLLGPDHASDPLATAIASAVESKSEALPGLMALGGVAIVDNGTHYPQVGTMTRLVRNADSPFDGDALDVTWTRTIKPGEAPAETKTTRYPNLVEPATIETPTWQAPPLAFLQTATTTRTITTDLEGVPVAVTQVLEAESGQLRDWMVSPTFAYDRTVNIAEQNHAPQSLTPDDLVDPAKLEGWVAARAGDDGIVDLLAARGGEETMAYATTTFDAKAAGNAVLGFRSDDGIEAWLNGTKIHSSNSLRGINHPWEEVPVWLKEGRNVLLVKVTQASAGWGFIVSGREPTAEDAEKNPTWWKGSTQ